MTVQAYEVIKAHVLPRDLAGVRARVPFGRVAEYFGRHLDQVYAASKAGHVALDGQNVFVYQPRSDGDLTVDFCVGVTKSFEPVGSVVPLQTPGGLAAMTTHVGAYTGLRGAHDAVQAWVRANQRTLAGPSWEVYGHWHDDPAQLRTDVYYLLRA